jgi:hypothetical protein
MGLNVSTRNERNEGKMNLPMRIDTTNCTSPMMTSIRSTRTRYTTISPTSWKKDSVKGDIAFTMLKRAIKYLLKCF